MPEILINGIDISECAYCLNNKLQGKTHAPSKSMPYAKETSCIACKADITKYNFCKHNPDCYYKQLQRLKQENKAMQRELEDIAEARMEICNSCGEKTEYNIPCKMIRDLDYGLQVALQENDKYMQALNEIQAIANETIIIYTHIAKLKPELKGLDLRNRMQKILYKIQELGGEEKC